jgi:chorismate mutase/prephenate dehydratase
MTPESVRKAIADCRERIDTVDRRILALLNERARIAEQIGQHKRECSMPIVEPGREDDVLRNVSEHNTGPLSSDAVKRVFASIIAEMRAVQRERMESGDPGDSRP